MEISVIIPTYNRATMLVDAILSLASQDFESSQFEILVVDNNSRDNTKEVVEKSQAEHPSMQIRYISETRQGDYYARNTGAKYAKGKYLVFTDDDALFDANYLSVIFDLFQKYPLVGVVGTRIAIKWEGGSPNKWVKPYQFLLGEDSQNERGYQIYSEGRYVNNGSLAIKRDLYISVGGNNPGQVGDYLVGDAEYGLYKKIQKLHIPVAFTDDVTMWHRQIVGKNDTMADIQRRMENFGISDAYEAVFAKKDYRTKKILPLYVKYVLSFLRFKQSRRIAAYFAICKAKKYNEYIMRYQNDQELLAQIEACKQFDWEE